MLQWDKHNICKYDPFNWRSLTAAYLRNLYPSMPRKMVPEMAAEGGAMKNWYIEILLYKKKYGL